MGARYLTEGFTFGKLKPQNLPRSLVKMNEAEVRRIDKNVA